MASSGWTQPSQNARANPLSSKDEHFAALSAPHQDVCKDGGRDDRRAAARRREAQAAASSQDAPAIHQPRLKPGLSKSWRESPWRNPLSATEPYRQSRGRGRDRAIDKRRITENDRKVKMIPA
jgi:hypothetical protein